MPPGVWPPDGVWRHRRPRHCALDHRSRSGKCRFRGCASERVAALLDGTAIVVGSGADVVYDVRHQMHGAIGFTREYALHRHSLDMLRWRDHLYTLRAGELRCAKRLGALVIAINGPWQVVTTLMKSGDPG